MNQNQNMKISAHCILACIYFLLLPTTIAINSSGNSILKLATIPIAGYFIITIIFSKKVLQFNSIHFLLCLYTLTTLITLFINYEANAIDTVTGYFLNAALYLCLTVVNYNKKELLLLENIQVILLVILVALTLFSSGTEDGRTTLMIFGQWSDPNYFVGFFIFPLTITIKKIINSKYRILYVLLVLLSLYCVFLTGSRGGLLAIIATVAAFALIYPQKIKTKIFLFAGGAAFLILAWLIAAPILPENIIERMSIESVVETGGSGRWDILVYMVNEIIKTPEKLIFGRGLTLIKYFSDGKWGSSAAHNQIIQVLYNQGVVGLVAFLLLTGGCLLRCLKKRKTVAIAIIGMMAISISLSFNQTTRTFWNLVAYAALNFHESEHNTPTRSLELSEED